MENMLSPISDKLMDIKSCLLIVTVCFFAFFINNNIIPADLMESRNLATAQEMLRTGNYLIPTMNGELRLEKPPLPTWIAAGVEHILPDNLSAQRCMTGIIATIMALFLYLLVRKMTKERLLALISAIVLVTSYNVIMMGRTATWDIYCHSFMLIAIYLIVCAFESKGAQWGRFILAGIFMGLSFLSKGPVAFYALLLPFLLGYGFVMRPEIKGKIPSVCVMIVLCLSVSFWWPCYIAVFHPETGMAVAGKESANWLNHNVRPLWYYWGFAAEAGIWALFWVTSLFYFFWQKNTEQIKTFRFSIIWTFVALILLSLIPEKKTRYLLPLLIPGSINIAFYIWYSIRDLSTKGKKILFRVNGSVVSAIALCMPILLYLLFVRKEALSWLVFILTSLIFIGLALWMLAGLYGKKSIFPRRIFVGTALVMITFLTFCFQYAGQLFINQQRYSIHAVRDNPAIEGLPFYHSTKEGIRMELVYEANRNITPLDIENDSLFYASLPFVLVSTEAAKDILQGKQVTIEYIDTFDNNWRKPDNKYYNKNMVKEVSIIRGKNDY
ncbi:MAG: glycosyltransferase family 39 protein [Bacteroidales bacterium]|jgi:4-amino-4-deoxy-L-arabinose transferase-like glycosyltransferase|nr:glycosyltransferase family 39 protein [Bacteroidales bacterium]